MQLWAEASKKLDSNLVLPDEVDRRFRNEEEQQEERNVETGEYDGQQLPVQERAEDVASDHAESSGDGWYYGKPASEVRGRDLHDIDR